MVSVLKSRELKWTPVCMKQDTTAVHAVLNQRVSFILHRHKKAQVCPKNLCEIEEIV